MEDSVNIEVNKFDDLIYTIFIDGKCLKTINKPEYFYSIKLNGHFQINKCMNNERDKTLRIAMTKKEADLKTYESAMREAEYSKKIYEKYFKTKIIDKTPYSGKLELKFE